jgi:hypothetical protein
MAGSSSPSTAGASLFTEPETFFSEAASPVPPPAIEPPPR